MRKGDGEVADRDGVAIALGEQVEQQVGWVVAAARGERRAAGEEARAAAVKDMLEYEEAESTWKMSKFQNVPSRNRA